MALVLYGVGWGGGSLGWTRWATGPSPTHTVHNNATAGPRPEIHRKTKPGQTPDSKAVHPNKLTVKTYSITHSATTSWPFWNTFHILRTFCCLDLVTMLCKTRISNTAVGSYLVSSIFFDELEQNCNYSFVKERYRYQSLHKKNSKTF